MKKNTKLFAVFAAAVVFILLFWQFYYVPTQKENLQYVLTIEYTDGTFSQPLQSPMGLALFPLTIQDTTGKTVSAIRLELYATVDYTGEAKSWTMTGTLTWAINVVGGVDKFTTSMPLSQSGASAPPKNQPFVVSSASLTASQLEGLMTGWSHGTMYNLRFSVHNPTFTITFADGESLQKTLTATCTGQWTFKYLADKQFTSLSVSWNPVPYY